MPTSALHSIGPYELLTLVGEGGMGEVYKAYDTRLNRTVALKILPESFARDSARLSRFEQEGQKLTLHWDGPLVSVLGKAHGVSVTMGIELRGKSALFTLHLDNPTDLEIGETYFPFLGGLKGLGDHASELKQTALVIPNGNASLSVPIFETFTNFSWLGAQGPEQFYPYPGDWAAPWLDLYQPKLDRSVFLAVRDDPMRAKVLHLELVPGSSGTTRWDGNWPRPAELKGLPVGVRLAFAEFSNVPAGKPWDASPVELQFHAGDWKEGQKLFQAGKGR